MLEALREVQRTKTTSSKPTPLLTWVTKYRRFLAEGVPFDLSGHRYLTGVYKDKSRELVIMKSGQGGASEYCISRAIWSCDVRQMNVLYLLPTNSDISDFSQMRIGTALEASPYLAEVVVAGRVDGKRGSDRVQLKRVRDRWLVLRGAQLQAKQSGDGGPRSGASRLKSVPVDMVIYDEFDEMPAGVEALAVKRLGHSAYKEQVWVSTPTYPGVGIHDKWLLSDQRRWEVQCWHCNTWQPLTIDHVVIEQDDLGRPTAWHGQNEDRAFCACEQCGAELDRLADGRWVPQNPGAAITGYSFNKLATAQNDPLSVVLALLTTDESKRQEAFNQDLALPYRPRGGGLDASILDACQRDYAFSSATAVGETTVMGVDVGRVLNVVVRALDQGTGRHMRWAGEVMTFEEAADIAKRFRVSRIVMDALPETRKAREFQAMFPARVCWLAYYSDGGKAGEAVSWKDERGPEGWMGTVTVDRTRTLDETVHRFTAGENTLPGHIRSLPRYYEQLQAIVRVVQRQPSGIEIARYIETGADHYAHAENYATVASFEAKRSAGSWGRR